MTYHHQVVTQEPGYVVVYDGPDAADAMAAWSKAVGDKNVGYVNLESIQVGRSD